MLGELIRPLAQAKQALGSLVFVRTATKRAAGSRTSMKDSAGRRLGMKRSDGQPVKAGEIIYRQRGTKFYPGENTDIGKDHTIWAKEPGFVKFYYDPFHPKRRLIGVALKREYELPTPHFEPRRRRLGHVPLTTTREIEEEREWLSRKERNAFEELSLEAEQRQAVRTQRLDTLREQVSQFVELSSNEVDAACQRLLDLSVYISGGRDIVASRKMVDAAYIYDLEIACETGKITADEMASKIEEYQVLTSKLDSAVAIDAERKLFKARDQSQLDEMAAQAMQELENITKDAGLPLAKDIEQKVRIIIEQPCFDKSTQVKLQRRFIRAAPPQLIKDSEALKQFEEMVKNGKGEIVKSWNYEKRRVENFFLPKGTSKMAIV